VTVIKYLISLWQTCWSSHTLTNNLFSYLHVLLYIVTVSQFSFADIPLSSPCNKPIQQSKVVYWSFMNHWFVWCRKMKLTFTPIVVMAQNTVCYCFFIVTLIGVVTAIRYLISMSQACRSSLTVTNKLFCYLHALLFIVTLIGVVTAMTAIRYLISMSQACWSSLTVTNKMFSYLHLLVCIVTLM
jgi:hypothetical protein